jgi:hypothetical protein
MLDGALKVVDGCLIEDLLVGDGVFDYSRQGASQSLLVGMRQVLKVLFEV